MRFAVVDDAVGPGRGERIRDEVARLTLGSILAFGALNAFGGAWYGLAGAEGVPTEWLAGSPFSDYVIPSVVLGAVVGGSFSIAAIAVFRRGSRARLLALAAGVVVLGWLAVQVAIIGYVSWMQPATAAAGGLILALAGSVRVRPGRRPAAR
jgi:hypothetical protein